MVFPKLPVRWSTGAITNIRKENGGRRALRRSADYSAERPSVMTLKFVALHAMNFRV